MKMEMLKSDLLKMTDLMCTRGAADLTPDEVADILREVKPDLEIVEDAETVGPELAQLSDDQIRQKNEFVREFKRTLDKLIPIVAAYNEVVEELDSKIVAFNVWLDDTAKVFRGVYRNSPKQWQKSNEGRAFDNWVDDLYNAGDIETPDIIEEFVISDIENAIEHLENLPVSPEE